jgi:hypothetical protein
MTRVSRQGAGAEAIVALKKEWLVSSPASVRVKLPSRTIALFFFSSNSRLWTTPQHSFAQQSFAQNNKRHSVASLAARHALCSTLRRHCPLPQQILS